MNNFDKCFNKLIDVEGGYANDPHDAGGETYLGISRKNNPDWVGWITIDNLKKQYPSKSIKGIIKYLKNDDISKLKDQAKLLYKTKYWDVMSLDDIKNITICNHLFDTAVNMGVKTAINLAQQCCGMSITGKFSDELLYNLKKL